MLHILCYIFLNLVLIFLTVLGFAEAIRFFILKFYKTENNNTALYIISLPKTNNNTEYILRSTITKARWMQKNSPCRVICIDHGISEESANICRLLSEKYNQLEIMSKDALIDEIDKIN